MEVEAPSRKGGDCWEKTVWVSEAGLGAGEQNGLAGIQDVEPDARKRPQCGREDVGSCGLGSLYLTENRAASVCWHSFRLPF